MTYETAVSLVLIILPSGFLVSAYYLAKFNFLVVKVMRAVNAAANRDRKFVSLLWQQSSLYSEQLIVSQGDSDEWRKAVEACLLLRAQRRTYMLKGLLPMFVAMVASVVLIVASTRV
ncbi:hypothetical protein [Lysobacter arvi]|uniref:Universal stress protein B n=1 Tax=Lysobacter arvi TaxID=3038776 RepID=A0ABU1CF48_9GAMM|nr:hypothetical protein [Lysobacter arvi]MDR0183570.1 hypothetical protein [Lysobacter arvi]